MLSSDMRPTPSTAATSVGSGKSASAEMGRTPRALLSGGGSGGHVFPGLALASELDRRGWQVDWAGTERGMESRLVSQRGLNFHSLPAAPLLGTGAIGKLRSLTTLARSVGAARRLVRSLGVRVVVGTGGYVSAPAVVGARLAGKPVMLFEPNAEPGVANRWLSRLAQEAALAWDGSGRALRCPVRTTGIPVRAEFFDIPEPAAGEPLRLLVLGGSQGAQQLNELVPAALAGLRDGARVEICHQAGKGKDAATRDAYRQHAGPGVRSEVLPFLDDVAGQMARSHLLISRAGAITLAEIAAAGRASVLVPLAGAAGGHQIANARRFAEAGAARLLAPEKDADLRASQDLLPRLKAYLQELLAEPQQLLVMGRAARDLAQSGAAQSLADRVEAISGLSAGDRTGAPTSSTPPSSAREPDHSAGEGS